MTSYWNKMWGEKSSTGKPAPKSWTPPETKKDPLRNKGKVSYSVKDLTPDERASYDHVTCTGCGGEVYPSAYIKRDRCDLAMCWGAEAKLPRTLEIETDLAVTHSYAGGYQGSYNTSMTKFSSFTRSRTTPIEDAQRHLLSRVAMAPSHDEYRIEGSSSTSLEHETLQSIAKKSTGDEFLSNVSEAYTHEIVEEVELFTRAVEKHAVTPQRKEGENLEEHQWEMRQLVEHIGAQLGAAIGHKIGDEWFLRDTTDEAKTKQSVAGKHQQPAYAAGLYGETPPAKDRLTKVAAKEQQAGGSSGNFWDDAPVHNTHMGEAIDKLGIAPALSSATSKVAKAKPEERLQTMVDELMPLVEQIIEQQGGETDNDGAKKAVEEAMKGKGESQNPVYGYEEKIQSQMNRIGKDIVDRQLKKKENDKRKAKWNEAAKNIAKAYGHDGDSASVFGSMWEPLYEAKSRAPKPVKLSWKASQMLEAVKSERRITTAEAGDPTDKMVELNFGNLKVFRKEEVYNPKLLIGVDTSGSTGCICDAGNDDLSYVGAGSLMWEIATALSQAGTEQNTKLYGYGSSHRGHLSVIETPNGHRVQCITEFQGDRYNYEENSPIPEHGGGTPELAMLHYLQDRAMTLGSLPETTVILITDGMPDRQHACAEMSKEMVKAGVRFGSVVVGGRLRKDYYSSDVAVHVKRRDDIETALPKLLSLIQGRGIS